LKTDLGAMKTVSRHFLDPTKIVLIDSWSGRCKPLKWKFWVMKASENIFQQLTLYPMVGQVAFTNFHKTLTNYFQLALNTLWKHESVWKLKKKLFKDGSYKLFSN
jgi:hypothetical protein